jgi:dTMP kinase
MGKYVGVEGPDGCGKSTLVAGLSEEIVAAGFDVIQTNEPGGNPLGKKLRAILKDPEMQAVTHPLTRRMIFEADRITQQALVRQWLELEERYVISDRHCPVSNTAYGIAEGSGVGFIQDLEALDPDRLLADLVVLVDVPEKVSLARQQARGIGVDPAERDRNMFVSVCRVYRRMIAEALDTGYLTTLSDFRIPAVVVDGTLPPRTVVAKALGAINSRIPFPTR